MNAIFSFVLSFLVASSIYETEALKTISDDDLTELIRSETYFVTLFSTKNCPTCDNFENILNDLEEEFQKSLNARTVKVINSQLTRLYSPTKEPLVVFFRHGIPLLYNDVPSEELILHTFLNNKDPIVKELNDQTFEHLTQAATGATTGDWFVMFYTSDCVDCHRLQARWETVGAKLKTRMNVARVNKGADGASTAARFGVSQVPSFVLFRQGKLYRYQIQKYDIASFISFAQEWYKNMKPERVPHPRTPFDEMVENIVTRLRENPILWQMGLLSSLFVLVVLVFLLRGKKESPQEQKQKTSKKEDKDE